MKYKRIVFAEPCVAKLIDFELNDPANGEVQVRLAVSSLSSGTERANLTGSKTVSCFQPDEKEAIFPRYSGYSSAGVIEKVGEGVSDFHVGDRVALCWSKHSEVWNVSVNNLCRIDDISFEDAALFNIATFPLAAIRKCRTEIGESAVVMGMGVLGIVALQLLKAAGTAPIVAVDPDPTKREKALQCGADYAFDPYSPTFAQDVKEVTDGGANVGIEVTGIGAGLNGILDCMARFGRVALLGCTRSSDFNVDYYRKVHGPGITLVGAHTMARPGNDSSGGWWTQQDDMNALVKLTKTGRIALSAVVDETCSPADAPEVYTRLVNEKSFPIVQFDWRRLS